MECLVTLLELGPMTLMQFRIDYEAMGFLFVVMKQMKCCARLRSRVRFG